eukprot:jgi/Tetstr1/466503/TSEL_011010.t1
MLSCVMRALESKRVSISLMEACQLERSGGGMTESVMATAWGGGALSTEPISSHAHSARFSSGERAFEAALMMVEEVADQQSGGKSTAEEKTAGGEAETERSFAIYRPGQLARQREEEEDRKRANAQRNASTAVEEASVCRRSGKWEPATDYRRSATEADIKEQALRLPKGSATRRCLEQQAEVANKGIFALQPTGTEAKEQPETARLDTITCELHANNSMLQCETISDGGSSHTRMNAMEPSAAEAVVKGAGGWVDVDMVVVLANGKRSCEQQRRLRDGVVFTLRDPVTSIMAAHHAPRVYENGGEAPGLLLGGPTITALGLRPDPATRICAFRAPNRPAGRVPLLSQTAWERRVLEHQPVVRVERASYCHGVELGDDEMGEESGGGSDVSHSHAAHEPSRRDVQESKTCEPADLPPLREVQSLQRHGLARLSTREEGISMYEPCGGGYVAVLNAMLATGQKVARYRLSDIDPAARKAAGQRVQGAQQEISGSTTS